MNKQATPGDQPGPPEPPVPEDADLRQFRHFAIDVHRLLTSETWVLATGDEAKAALTLWLQAFHSVPAGSLPASDRMLAHLSMAGAAWDSVREHAMRGWVEHADGRLYHPVVTEKVIDALKRSEDFVKAKEAHRQRMREWRKQHRDDGVPEGERSRDDHVIITEPSRDADVIDKKRKRKEKEKRKESNTPPILLGHPGGGGTIPPPMATGEGDSKAETYPAAFEAFWKAYPRKVGKLAAFRAYQRAVKLMGPEPHPRLLEAASRYAKACVGKEEQYIAHAQTWLNQGRWGDEPTSVAAKPSYVPMAANGG